MSEAPAADDPSYRSFLADLKTRIRSTQLSAAQAVNTRLITLYWEIGREILTRQQLQGWGSKVIERLSKDLAGEFPGMKGFSPRNLKYMRAFAAAYPDAQIVQQVVAQIPWGHNVRILDHVGEEKARLWYAQKTLANGWSRNMLVHQIEARLIEREGKAVTNFPATLPAPDSDLAGQMLKDPYKLDFLGIGEEAREKELETALLAHIRKFLLELGAGFAFVGSQYPLTVGGDEFYIDLLFYHLRLRCYVVIELKTGKFLPEYAGKLNFYLSAVDDLLRHPDDRPTIGLILCKDRNGLVAEYALRDLGKPVGVASYVLADTLPPELRENLPDLRQLELGLEEGDGDLLA